MLKKPGLEAGNIINDLTYQCQSSIQGPAILKVFHAQRRGSVENHHQDHDQQARPMCPVKIENIRALAFII